MLFCIITNHNIFSFLIKNHFLPFLSIKTRIRNHYKKMDNDVLPVENLQKYLRIPTTHPNINYEPVIEFLRQIAHDLQLSISVYEYVVNNPIAVLTWIGIQPSLPSILLNSHMDTVAVNNKENWTHDPFGGVIDEAGNIHGRGAQDCKSVGVMYLEAIRRLKQKGVRLQRTVHVLFVPDEETGGIRGMNVFVKEKNFHELNIGFGIDEAMPNVNNKFTISYSDKLSWKFVIRCKGSSGLGFLMINNTAGEKVSYILEKFYKFRFEETQKLKRNPSMILSDIISINLTMIQGGEQFNVIPEQIELVFDCRLPPSTNSAEVEATFRRWCTEAGDGVTLEFLIKDLPYFTQLDETNKFWVALKKTIKEMQVPYETIVYHATTDARFLRKVGVPCIGFLPLRNTVPRKHEDNEYISKAAFLKAIECYTIIIPALGNV